MENGHLEKMYSLLKMQIFYCYVSLPECTTLKAKNGGVWRENVQ